MAMSHSGGGATEKKGERFAAHGQRQHYSCSYYIYWSLLLYNVLVFHVKAMKLIGLVNGSN